MRNVNYGWLIRYLPQRRLAVLLRLLVDMARALYSAPASRPRAYWIISVIIYVLMMATAFFGYVLPWGGMSFAGATVITGLTSAIPVVGDSVADWLWAALRSAVGRSLASSRCIISLPS